MGLTAATKTPSSQVRVQQEELAQENFPCRVSQVIDLGVHHRTTFDVATNSFVKVMDKAPVNMLMITYEFTTEFMKDADGNEQEDRPRWLSETLPIYALDNDLATSTKRMKAFDPDFSKLQGDWSLVAGMPCAVTIVHKKNGKAKIGNVAKPMKGMQVAELKNPVKVFNLDEPDLDVFRSLPEWLQTEIKENLHYAGSPLEALLAGDTPKAANGRAEEKKAPVASTAEPNVEEEGEDEPW